MTTLLFQSLDQRLTLFYGKLDKRLWSSNEDPIFPYSLCQNDEHILLMYSKTCKNLCPLTLVVASVTVHKVLPCYSSRIQPCAQRCPSDETSSFVLVSLNSRVGKCYYFLLLGQFTNHTMKTFQNDMFYSIQLSITKLVVSQSKITAHVKSF